jgi:folate-dependent phosphoribosylglycinamide formyltransferase PurN
MAEADGVFATLPENFFSPLVWSNKRHYAALIVLYYRLFQENSRGLERELVIREFAAYFALHQVSLVEEAADEASNAVAIDAASADTDYDTVTAAVERQNERALAAAFLRRLIASGWLSDETLADYSRIVNITPYARPFFEALARVEEGLKTEYESHVVAVYSLLYNDSVADNGHYAVLNAHSATVAMIDSLKILSGSIKTHYERFTREAVSAVLRNRDGAEEGEEEGSASSVVEAGVLISNILHLHYDIYAGEILDGAYKRLKTSDNLSRYRPRIIKKVADLLADEQWLNSSARKLSRNNSQPFDDNCRRLQTMLNEIRDTLRAVDPLLEDIDRRNMLYARSSTERVKALLEPDSTIAGKIGILVREIHSRKDSAAAASFRHRLHRVKTLTRESLYRRYKHEAAEFIQKFTPLDKEAMDNAENEFMERISRQLNVKKICDWLDENGGNKKLLTPEDLIKDEGSFIHFIYTVLYADARPSFLYEIQDTDSENNGAVSVSSYTVPDVILRKKDEY